MIMLKDYSQNREAIPALLPRMFEMIAQNTQEEDRKLWTQAMLEEIKKPEKRWVAAFSGDTLAGYALYRVCGVTLHMDEVQVAKAQQGDGKIFPGLLGKLLRDANNAGVRKLCGYANENNQKAQGILRNLGLRPAEQTPRGQRWEGSFEDALAWFKEKYSTCRGR
jgi:hypothetical protein